MFYRTITAIGLMWAATLGLETQAELRTDVRSSPLAATLGLETQAELRTDARRSPLAVRSSPWSSRASTREQSSDTANLYRIHCSMCHGPLGKALIPEMAFVGRKWKHGTKTSDMVKTITEGVKGTPMLPFKGKLTPAQIRALAHYVRAFDKTLKPEK